jgi:hypothetical protein
MIGGDGGISTWRMGMVTTRCLAAFASSRTCSSADVTSALKFSNQELAIPGVPNGKSQVKDTMF